MDGCRSPTAHRKTNFEQTPAGHGHCQGRDLLLLAQGGPGPPCRAALAVRATACTGRARGQGLLKPLGIDRSVNSTLSDSVVSDGIDTTLNNIDS